MRDVTGARLRELIVRRETIYPRSRTRSSTVRCVWVTLRGHAPEHPSLSLALVVAVGLSGVSAGGDALGGALELQDRSEARVDLLPARQPGRAEIWCGPICATPTWPGPNLTGAKLTRANLATANLARAKLTRARLDTANLAFANLVGAAATDANLSRATLNGANLARANLSGSQPVPRESRGRKPGRREPRSREPGAGEPGRREPRRRQSRRREPQHGFAGRDEPQPREPDPSRARERDLERCVSDRHEPLRRKPAWRDGDGRGPLEGEPRRREARRMSAGTAPSARTGGRRRLTVDPGPRPAAQTRSKRKI